MENEWKIDSNESDILIKTRHSLIDYMSGSKNNFKGRVAIQNNEVKDASIEFSLKANDKNRNSDLKLIDFFGYNETPIIQFKSTSFQKINKNINFIKGHLTIKISLDSTGPFSLWLLHTCYLVLGPKDYRFSVVDEPLDLGTMINVKTLVENVRFNCTSKFLLRDEHIDISINKNIPLRIDKDGLRYGTLIVDPIDGVKAE